MVPMPSIAPKKTDLQTKASATRNGAKSSLKKSSAATKNNHASKSSSNADLEKGPPPIPKHGQQAPKPNVVAAPQDNSANKPTRGATTKGNRVDGAKGRGSPLRTCVGWPSFEFCPRYGPVGPGPGPGPGPPPCYHHHHGPPPPRPVPMHGPPPQDNTMMIILIVTLIGSSCVCACIALALLV